jgi:hypothetical protein
MQLTHSVKNRIRHLEQNRFVDFTYEGKNYTYFIPYQTWHIDDHSDIIGKKTTMPDGFNSRLIKILYGT